MPSVGQDANPRGEQDDEADTSQQRGLRARHGSSMPGAEPPVGTVFRSECTCADAGRKWEAEAMSHRRRLVRARIRFAVVIWLIAVGGTFRHHHRPVAAVISLVMALAVVFALGEAPER